MKEILTNRNLDYLRRTTSMREMETFEQALKNKKMSGKKLYELPKKKFEDAL